jgi:DNA-binding MarR family transcriptional regulator
VDAEAFARASGPLSERLATGLAKVSLALKHEARRDANSRGLSATQAQALLLLTRGPATPGRLAEELGIGAATTSEALGALVAKGLVRRDPSPADGRSRTVALTAAGRRRARDLADWPDVLREAIDALSPEEQASLLGAIVKLIVVLQARGRIPVARMCATCRFFRPNVHDDPARPHHCAFVDAPFGEPHLRVDCEDHEPAA